MIRYKDKEREGYNDYYRGVSIYQDPYKDDNQEFSEAWRAGWRKARLEDMTNQYKKMAGEK